MGKVMGHAVFSSWPWEFMGSYKYLLYAPLLSRCIYSMIWEETQNPHWCLHILLLSLLRGLVHQLWISHNNMFFSSRNRIHEQGIDFNQIDREWQWDNFIILQAFMASLALITFPFLANLPTWNTKGIIYCGMLHMGISEPLYYWSHRLLHNQYFFSRYHSLHHSSTIATPFTVGNTTFLEQLLMGVIVGIPTLGTSLMGCGSISLIYAYFFIFDYLRCLGHSNAEIIPHSLFNAFPPLKYFLYTPTYHSLHHSEMNTNFCLFMPLYDAIWKTMNKNSWLLHEKISSGKNEKRADFVFLAHVVDIMSAGHCPFFFRSMNSLPFSFSFQLLLIPVWPFLLLFMLGLWTMSNTIPISFYILRRRLHQTWVVPRYGFQYFLPFAKEGINKVIEEAILRADTMGVKVISLAALNKSESLNGGGTLYVNKHPKLKVRVVHGNTLTAAVILNQIPPNVTQVFLTGATSKLGRAISLYLCRRKVLVMMLTQSSQRFKSIQREAPVDCQKYLAQVTKYEAAQHCKTWIIGKWCTPKEQGWAPPGTHFHQFVVPPIISFRRDCTYGKLAAMKLPQDVEGLGSCEYTMERGAVHACHAGGIVHLLEGWNDHEVGAIDVDHIDVVWGAALKHGFKPV